MRAVSLQVLVASADETCPLPLRLWAVTSVVALLVAVSASEAVPPASSALSLLLLCALRSPWGCASGVGCGASCASFAAEGAAPCPVVGAPTDEALAPLLLLRCASTALPAAGACDIGGCPWATAAWAAALPAAAPRAHHFSLTFPEFILVSLAPLYKPLQCLIVIPCLAAHVIFDLLERRPLALGQSFLQDHELVAFGDCLTARFVVGDVALQHDDCIQQLAWGAKLSLCASVL